MLINNISLIAKYPRWRWSFTFVERRCVRFPPVAAGLARGGRATQQEVELLQCPLLVNPKSQVR